MTLPGEVISPGDPRQGRDFGNILIILIPLLVVVSAFLVGPVFREFRGSREKKNRARLGGILLTTGLISILLAQLWVPESILAQLVALGVSVGCCWAAWRIFTPSPRDSTPQGASNAQ